VDKEDVMTCLIKGCNFVLKNIPHEAFMYQKDSNPEFRFQTNHPNIFPYLLVNIGSGVSIVKVRLCRTDKQVTQPLIIHAVLELMSAPVPGTGTDLTHFMKMRPPAHRAIVGGTSGSCYQHQCHLDAALESAPPWQLLGRGWGMTDHCAPCGLYD
jgi:hypothetical protein